MASRQFSPNITSLRQRTSLCQFSIPSHIELCSCSPTCNTYQLKLNLKGKRRAWKINLEEVFGSRHLSDSATLQVFGIVKEKNKISDTQSPYREKFGLSAATRWPVIVIETAHPPPSSPLPFNCRMRCSRIRPSTRECQS